VYDKKEKAGSATPEMCRASYRRKNIVDSARPPPQYLRSVLTVAALAIVRRAGVKNSLGRKVQEESSMATKKKAKKKKH